MLLTVLMTVAWNRFTLAFGVVPIATGSVAR